MVQLSYNRYSTPVSLVSTNMLEYAISMISANCYDSVHSINYLLAAIETGITWSTNTDNSIQVVLQSFESSVQTPTDSDFTSILFHHLSFYCFGSFSSFFLITNSHCCLPYQCW